MGRLDRMGQPSSAGCLGNGSLAFDVISLVAKVTSPECLSLHEVTIAMVTEGGFKDANEP